MGSGGNSGDEQEASNSRKGKKTYHRHTAHQIQILEAYSLYISITLDVHLILFFVWISLLRLIYFFFESVLYFLISLRIIFTFFDIQSLMHEKANNFSINFLQDFGCNINSY